MEERKLRDGVRREDVLEADVLRVVAQTLFLILACEFLLDAVRDLEIRAAEVEHATQTVVGVELIVEPEETFAGAAEVVKVINGGGIEIALRRAGGKVGQK